MARNNQRGSKNNNPEGRNQYSSGWMGTAKERPVATAAAAAAAVGAGVFLWSRRNQISEQISNLSDQFNDWTSSQQYGGGSESGDLEYAGSGSSGIASDATGSTTSSGARGRGKSASQSGSGLTGGTASTTTGGTTGGGASF